jgi:hypothetical protein
MENCELCDREKELTFHHLIPKCQHSKKSIKKIFDKKEMQTRGLDLCGDCHPMIHKFIKNKDMARTYNTKEMLLSHEEVAKFVTWVSKQNKKAKR